MEALEGLHQEAVDALELSREEESALWVEACAAQEALQRSLLEVKGSVSSVTLDREAHRATPYTSYLYVVTAHLTCVTIGTFRLGSSPSSSSSSR